MVLLFLCLATALTNILDGSSALASRFATASGALFILMGALGFAIEASSAWKQELGVSEDGEFQPAFLNVWFIGWGAFCVWVGAGNALVLFDALDKLLRGYLPQSGV